MIVYYIIKIDFLRYFISIEHKLFDKFYPTCSLYPRQCAYFFRDRAYKERMSKWSQLSFCLGKDSFKLTENKDLVQRQVFRVQPMCTIFDF